MFMKFQFFNLLRKRGQFPNLPLLLSKETVRCFISGCKFVLKIVYISEAIFWEKERKKIIIISRGDTITAASPGR